MTDEDYALALQLQSHLFDDSETNNQDVTEIPQDHDKPMSLVDPYWELTDPNPDMRALFLEFNEKYFWGRLAGVEVKWSSRMTLLTNEGIYHNGRLRKHTYLTGDEILLSAKCAGLCRYEGRGGLCSISLSVPLLKLRPRKDLIETLLHEMIHAYLFVTDNNKDHDGHGPEFHKHMYRLNKQTGTNITVYHNFHDEVDLYKQHWWRCNGPCQNRKPYFGYVKRSMNRAPSKNDMWWAEHQRTCGGTYTKIKEPEGYGKKKSKTEKGETNSTDKGGKPTKTGVKSMDIRIFGGEGKTLGKPQNSGSTNFADQRAHIKSIPTATITSGVLSKPDKDVKPKWKDKNTVRSDSTNSPVKVREGSDPLPGASTPTKGVKNKPVSQGGNVPFSKVKKKTFPVIDFSDSDDDDDLFNSVPQVNSVKTTETINSNDDGKNINSCDIKDPSDSFGVSKPVTNSGNEISNKNEDDIDTNDVRAMLRKVWGQKHISKSKKLVNVHNNNSSQTGQKRESFDGIIDITPANKRIKLNNGEQIDNHRNEISVKKGNRSDLNTSSPTLASANERIQSDISKYKTGSHGHTKVTSPIEKLFNQIKDKQKQDVKLGAPANLSTSVIGEQLSDCDKSTTTVISNGERDVDSESSVCPVCNQNVPIASINDHLDLCLTLKAIS